MIASNSKGNPGTLCTLTDFPLIKDLINKTIVTIICTPRNAKINISLGHIKQTVMALTASAPPHHLNSHAAQKPMIARVAKGEVWTERYTPRNNSGNQVIIFPISSHPNNWDILSRSLTAATKMVSKTKAQFPCQVR